MSVSKTAKKLGIKKILNRLYKSPEKNLRRLMDWADKYAGDLLKDQRQSIRDAITDPENPYYPFVRHILRDVDPKVAKTIAVNFFINANLVGVPIQFEMRKKYDCNIPWAILLDPTSACNIHCLGCWAADYGVGMNLSFEEMDSIITQGKEMGVYFYLFSGGEPLIRKDDIISLCKKHDDCMFTAFTNGTLIDDAFADELLRVRNFAPAISLEGFREATDSRRGEGTYDLALNAMRILREHKLVYGVSCCYTSENYESITSDEYWNMMIENGAYFVWYFHYMPVGNDANTDLLPSPAQREYVCRRIRNNRRNKPLFAMDFQNDGATVNGCIAAGRRYFHINANGDAEPCAFIHYADSNIRDKTLLEILQSPLFMAYHERQPFNDNMLRPCPMLENPDKLREIVKLSGAKSTDMKSPESVNHLCSKCDSYAEEWAPTADRLWKEQRRKKK